MICSITNCNKPSRSKGMCVSHYQKQRRAEIIARRIPCSTSFCSGFAVKRGMCEACYERVRDHGTVDREKMPAGFGSLRPSGYVDVQVGDEHKGQHILVAEKALGKPLPPGAVVHHVNEKKSDNRGRNLVICPSHAYHMLIHKRMRDLGISFK